jgi:hypothetical protein
MRIISVKVVSQKIPKNSHKDNLLYNAIARLSLYYSYQNIQWEPEDLSYPFKFTKVLVSTGTGINRHSSYEIISELSALVLSKIYLNLMCSEFF